MLKYMSGNNLSLAGAVKTAVEPDSIRILEHIVSISGEVVLADSVEFQELYIERMNF